MKKLLLRFLELPYLEHSFYMIENLHSYHILAHAQNNNVTITN